MKLHTVIVSYNRLSLLQRTVASYLATVEGPYVSACIVDNGSGADTTCWLRKQKDLPVTFLGMNRYPGFATNYGFERAPAEANFLHRSDNDVEYLPGWCQAARERFGSTIVGQVGLRTDDEELNAPHNVGGNAIFRRVLWDGGLRYREQPWIKLGTMTEDYWISVAVRRMGWEWTRVTRPSIIHTATGDMTDPYYQQSYGIRGIA